MLCLTRKKILRPDCVKLWSFKFIIVFHPLSHITGRLVRELAFQPNRMQQTALHNIVRNKTMKYRAYDRDCNTVSTTKCSASAVFVNGTELEGLNCWTSEAPSKEFRQNSTQRRRLCNVAKSTVQNTVPDTVRYTYNRRFRQLTSLCLHASSRNRVAVFIVRSERVPTAAVWRRSGGLAKTFHVQPAAV